MPPAPRGLPTLRIRLRWQIQDTIDRFVKSDGFVREPAKFEKHLSEAIEVVLVNHGIDIHMLSPDIKPKG